MKADVKQKWIAALRSGEYQQGYGCLCKYNILGEAKYCCLGVLAELAVADGAIEKSQYIGYVCYEGESTLLPNEVIEWAGLDAQRDVLYRSSGILPVDGVSLVDMNDTCRETFSTIADTIEKRL